MAAVRAAGSASAEVGARIHLAVEALLRARLPQDASAAATAAAAAASAMIDPRALYQAACRFVLRLLVIRFAEARGYLPTDDPVYQRDYGLGSLCAALAQPTSAPTPAASGGEAWPRLLRLFRLLQHGSAPPQGAVPALAELLLPCDSPAEAQALAALESAAAPPGDADVAAVLLPFTQLPRGRRAATAVDFATLPSECIGCCYEALQAHTLAPPDAGAPRRLVRAGGARKGRGAFYTPPELALAAVQRTLAPLLYDATAALRPPEELLAIRVCDPAMGSGAFLLAALRVLGEAVVASLSQHGRLHAHGALLRIDCPLLSPDATAQPAARLIPLVRRAVVERCLYGVDLDPLAVALARLSLWLATDDRQLPLDPLTSRLRCGDALIGGFRAQLGHYPLAAWRRLRPAEGGKAFRARLRADQRQTAAPASPSGEDAAAQRQALELYCALWFWPRSELAAAPLPSQLHAPSATARALARALGQRRRFFHWELEFPEVFTAPAVGFDAIVGNPPWEISKPSSHEFFSALDARYRGYDKQQALGRQRELLAAATHLQASWRDYLDGYADNAHFVRHAFQHQGSADLNSYKVFIEQALRLLRPGGQLGMVTPSGVYTDHGALALRRLLLTRCGWRLLYGFQNERHLFRGVHHAFKQCLLIAEKSPPRAPLEVMFRIGVGESPTAADIPLHLGAGWQPVPYPLALVQALSPQSLALIELRSHRDLAVLTRIYDGSVLLDDPSGRGPAVQYASEFHLTSDSHLFVARDRARQAGYAEDAYGRWRGPQGDVLLPLYQGVMFYGFAPSAAQHEGGAGRAARWRRTREPGAPLVPQFLVPAALHHRRRSGGGGQSKVAFRTLANATNERTFITCLIPDLPCGNSVGLLTVGRGDLLTHAYATACLGSLVYDYTLRQRIGGTNINYCFLQETAWPAQHLAAAPWLVGAVLALCAPAWRYAALWLEARPHLRRVRWAETPHERLRLRCMLDAAVAALYGLSGEDLRFILRGCDHPRDRLAASAFCRTLDPKGFWRVDRQELPELRHPVLTQVAFAELEQRIAEHAGDRAAAVAAFLSQNDGEGWMLPRELCLAAHGLGHDDRAGAPQPVQAALGERLADWQRAQSDAQSLQACTWHAQQAAQSEGE